MKLLAINHIDLFNYAIQLLLNESVDLIKLGKSFSINIDIDNIDDEINRILNDINTYAFNNNARIIVINGSTLFKNKTLINITNQSELPTTSMVVNKEFRQFIRAYNVNIPTSSKLDELYYIFSKQKYSHIIFVDLDIDYYKSVISLNNTSPININHINVRDILDDDNECISYSILISPYDFYNFYYNNDLVSKISDKMHNILKTKCDRIINSILN